MNAFKLLVWPLFVAFGLYSTWVIWDVGYLGLWQAGLVSPASLQILLDLCISCLLIGVWMMADARARGVSAWPWLLALVLTGSLAAMAYWLVRGSREPMAAGHKAAW